MTHPMRRAAIAVVVLLVSVPAFAAEKRYGLTSFEAIEVSADVDVEVVTRAPVSAVASGPQDALDRLEIEARDGRLVIRQLKFAGDDARKAPLGRILIRVNAANLRAATLVGAGSLTIDGMKATRVSIGLRGPGRLSVGRLVADRLQLQTVGNGSITLAGTVKQGDLMMSGANAVDAGDLKIDELISDSEGAGDHRFFAVKSAAVTARGVGKTVVLGRPVCAVRALGSASVTCGPGK